MKPTTVDDYINGFPEDKKAKLSELRRVINTELTDTHEELKWGNPAVLDEDRMILVVFSGHKDHMNLVATPSTKLALEDELSGYITGKGSVQLAYDKPLPVPLIKKMVSYRADEYRNKKVNWK